VNSEETDLPTEHIQWLLPALRNITFRLWNMIFLLPRHLNPQATKLRY